MSLVDDISDMTVLIEQQKETRQQVYNLLLRVLIELREQNHTIAVLKDKELNR